MNSRRLKDAYVAMRVLVRRGVIDPMRPDLAIHAIRAAKRYGAFGGLAVHAARRYGGATAIIDDYGKVTFADIETLSNALAGRMMSYGLVQGDVVGVICRNHRNLLLAVIAGNKLGVRVVLMSTGFAGPQLADICRNEQVAAVVADLEFAGLLQFLPRETTFIHASTAASDGEALHPVATSSQRIAPPTTPGGVVLLTSGTTGSPKGAPRDRSNPLVTAQLLDRIPWPTSGKVLVAAPIFHGTGLVTCTLGLVLGNCVLLTSRFDPLRVLEMIDNNRVEALVVVPTMLHRILELDVEILSKYDTSSLRVILCAGSALSPELCSRTAAAFGNVLYNLYGSTEVAIASIATPDELQLRPGTVGRPPVGSDIAIYDDYQRKITAADETGSIFVSSGFAFTGYTDGSNKDKIDSFISTGDKGHFDSEGLWYVDGRVDEMIISGGENVFPLEIENLLATHPGVIEAAVIGVDDPEFGERLHAFIVRDSDSQLDAPAMKEYVRGRLARHKVPRGIDFVDELPRNEMGKVMKSQLRSTLS